MEVRDRKILIIGMGKSGLAAAKNLASAGAIVTVADNKEAGELAAELQQLQDWPLTTVTGGCPSVSPGQFDLIVPSPGVPLWAAPLRQAMAQGIPVYSELELAGRLLKNPLIAVTGTNGKTTTTALIGAMFSDSGRSVSVVGNIGVPMIEEVTGKTSEHLFVAEVSSFQLEWVEEFHPQVALLTNLTPDHLERHGTMEVYLATKARLFQNQGPRDYTILNYDDPALRPLAQWTQGQVIFFSRRHKLEKGVFVEDGQICIAMVAGERELVCAVADLALPGLHNLENALGAVAAGRVLGLTGQQMAKTLRSFAGVPHRLERVATIKGVEYINDSKGTNPEAAVKALESLTRPLILLAGGSSKGEVDFSLFAQVIKTRVKELILMGETAAAIQAAVEKIGFSSVNRVDDMASAVVLASRRAQPGDVVLLSPACASFDAFKNFEHRGAVFKQLVQDLR